MVVNHEIKSQLAKLLATEDLIVEHKNVDTAQFNVHTRILILPQWQKASNDVYDMLVGHEVGHALFTSDIDWFLDFKIPPQFVNIVEDARIEKLMKRMYPGLAKSFYNGYNELNNQDFFEIDGKNLIDFNLADRVNLYFKIGLWVDIFFSSTEKSIVSLIKDCETFEDTLSAAEALYNFCKQEQEKETKQNSQQDSEDVGDSCIDSSSDNMSSLSDANGTDSVESGSSSDDSDIGGSAGSTLVDSEPEIKTADALENALKQLTDTRNYRESVYVELPKLDLDDIIIDNNEIHSGIDSYWGDFLEEHDINGDNIFGEVDNEFVKFKKSAQKEVNYLVKEFECRKSADSYARATIARTGVLDTKRLHTYKFNEDLFRKVSVVPDGKNHGLIFILDWSGSMAHVLLDTLKQLCNLLWFCKKVNIPFEVYAFTNDYPPNESIHKRAYEKKEGLVLIQETFSLMNMFTSKVNGKTLEHQMKNIFRIACAFNRNVSCPFNVPVGLGLSGTPLNETIVALHQILPKFKKENKLQKVQCVILTDGESAPIRYSREIQRHWEDNPFMGSGYLNDGCVIRNRKTGYTYSCTGLGYWADVTDLLLQDLRQSFSDINFIGIRLLGNRDASQFIRRYIGHSHEYDEVMKSWRKEKSFTIKNSGYDAYFGISATTLALDAEFDPGFMPTKAQIKSAFVKSLKNKKMNKKVLGEFIELVV